MRTTNKLKSCFITLSIIVLVIVTRNDATASAAPIPFVSIATLAAPADVLDRITLAGEYTDADVQQLSSSLQLLQKQLPVWSQYIEEAKPLVIAIDLNEGARGRAAIAKCCIAGGRGVITFGFHLGQSPDDAGQALAARQVTFIGTLVHEVTHIRDQRAGRFAPKTDRQSCVAAEKSGLEKQVQVKRALAALNLGAAYQQVLDEQINSEATALRSRELWDMYCGMFDH
ncbi:MAG: hypothetical protein HY868_03295 [Chloroflexi bacterium]|nr:hypothetical protein [Chloroflexota bacterium]